MAGYLARFSESASGLVTRRAAAIVSGVLLGLCYPPFPFPFLAWFAFVPLLFGWRRGVTARLAFLEAYLALLVTFAVAFHWPLLHELPATALLSLPPLLVIPMWMALPFGLACAMKKRFGTGAGLGAWIVLMILAEYGLRAGPLAFPWTLIGHSQAAVSPINGLAALGGVPLLSLVVLLANAALYLAVRRSFLRAGTAAAMLPGGAGRAGAVLPGGAGRAGTILPGSARSAAAILTGIACTAAGFMMLVADARLRESPARVAGIQPALSPKEWADLADSSRVTLLLQLSRDAAASDSALDLIIWPETAIPPLPATRPYLDRLQAFVDSSGIPVLAGAITTGGGAAAYRNSAVLSAPGDPILTYDKIHLVPFAERVPFTGVSSFFDRFAVPAGGVAGYEAGENRRIFEIPRMRFGVLICFETLFDGAARAYARDGADVLIAITQDGWWGDSFGYRQHLAFNRLRAIETGLPMIQSAVTGISALIHPDGRVHETAGWMERSVWIVEVPMRADPTPYVRLGDWVTMLAAYAAAAAAAFYTLRYVFLQRKQRRRHAN